MPHGISVAMIVRNEATFLRSCLDSIAGLGAELCIVDTGSEDDTLDIARSYGARIETFSWTDDFAAARNASLALCSRPWVLILDADERLAPEGVKRILALDLGPAARDRCFRFITRNYTHDQRVGGFQASLPADPWAEGFPGWFPSVKVRLFPRLPGVRFEGVVHELVTPSLVRLGLPIRECAAVVHHYGAARGAEAVSSKRETYLRLGLSKIQNESHSPRAYAELGNQYAELGDYHQAAAAYQAALRRNPRDATVLKDLGGVLHVLGRSSEAAAALQLALRIDPHQAEAWKNLGVVHSDQGAWAEALRCFRRAVAAAPEWEEASYCLRVAQEHLGCAPGSSD